MSVYGTGALVYTRAFLGTVFEESRQDCSFRSPCGTRTFITSPFSNDASPALKCRRCWNINQLDIAYAHRPQLSSRLTLGGRTFPRKPWVYGGSDFHRSYRYSCLHPHFQALHGRFPFRFTALGTLPYQSLRSKSKEIRGFGMQLIANHFRRRISR